MKKLALLLHLLSGSLAGQIAYETTYPATTIFGNQIGVIHLSASGYKYVQSDTDQIVIYNLNHTVFRTIPVPQQTNVNMNTFQIRWVSEELFNLNSNDVEFVMSYTSASGGVSHVKVYDESGNILFSRDSFFLSQTLGSGYSERAITYTSSGAKMLLTAQYGLQDVVVYSLPGTIPCHECNGGVISGLNNNSSGETERSTDLPYPNPSNSQTTLPYSLPAHINTGELIVYDLNGREVKRFRITNAFSSVVLSSEELAPGTYTYSILTSTGILPGNRFIIAE